MANSDSDVNSMSTPMRRSGTSRFEQIIANNAPILNSLIDQLPTESVLKLYHTSHFLNTVLRNSPISWRSMSWRLHQPVQTAPNQTLQQRQTGNYSLDSLLLYVIIPWSTRLKSLELDNTSVSGATLFQTVMVLRKDTLEHVSVRGCKNVSVKYHINPWLTLHALAREQPPGVRPPELQKLALKSLYTYRCRHHRRRPYMATSLYKKESDSEPTHELVHTCHKLGIWTDTAYCPTPAARCLRRRSYMVMRQAHDPREVWVVFDRLWRSRNWLGPPPNRDGTPRPKKRKRDGRLWEDEEAYNGEALELGSEGKDTPAHLRESHKAFVEDFHCDNCSERIAERCEQCSIMMHCSGCRKTLCASCAFDRPYFGNRYSSEEDKKKFWWAPGAGISPNLVQESDPNATLNQPGTFPNIKMRWCCTEPVFSGGGGITFGPNQGHDPDKLRAAPLPPARGYEDPEFAPNVLDDGHGIGSPLSRSTVSGPGGRWSSLAEMFRYGAQMSVNEESDTIPRILCDECHTSEQWKIKCKACSVALCLKHDVKEKQRVRICGYKELNVEKQELIARLKATKLFKTLWLKKKEQQRLEANRVKKSEAQRIMEEAQLALAANILLDETQSKLNTLASDSPQLFPVDHAGPSTLPIRTAEPTTASDSDPIRRPLSPGSNSSGPLSRASSPGASARSVSATPEPKANRHGTSQEAIMPSNWKGCQSFFCSAVRPTGDHRRRCDAVMRQCRDCRVFVCDECVAGIDKPCPCKGCRLPIGETDPITNRHSGLLLPKLSS